MEAGGDKNKEFLRWIRCLPKERRKDELQRIVSGGVLRGTSAKSALFKLQRRCFVKLRRLDIVRGMVAGATACPSPPVSAPVVAAPTAALPTSPSNPPCPPSCSPSPSSPPLKPKRLLGASRPCPLSRKRPSDTIREEDSKRSRISCDERQNIDPQACPQQTEPSSPAALSDQLKVSSDSPQSKDECSSDLPETKESASSGRRNPKEPLSGHTKSNEAQSAGLTLSPIRQSSHVPQSKNPQSIPPKSAPAPSEPSKPLPKNRLTASQPPLPHQRAQFSSRVVDEALKDVAKSIYDVETELFNIDQKLFSFDKLPPTHKTSRTLSALYETSKVISLKAGSIKSCIALGIAEFLGHSFYPKLLSEIIKIPKLKLYSSLRLTTMVNLLLHLSDPNTDPKYMVNAFMALNMNEWRPAENNKASKPPKRPAPNGSTLQASQLHVTLTQVSSVSQAINLPAYTEVVSHPPQSVEVTPQKPQQPELFMSQAPPPQNTLVQQQLEQQRQHELYLQQLERERQERERQERERQEQERQRQAQLQQQQYFQQQQQYQRQLQHQRMREYNQAMRQQQTTFQQNPVQQQPRTYPQHPAQNPSVSAAKSSRAAQRQQSTQNVQLPAANSMQGASNQSYQYPVPRGSRVPLPVMSTTDINLRTLLHSSSGPNVYYSSQTSNQMKTNNTQMYDSQVQVVHQAQHTTAVSLSQGPVAGQQQVSQGQHQVLQGQHYVPQMNPTYAQSALGSTAAYNPSNYQPIQSQQGFPVDNTAETTPYVYMTGQELMPGGIQFMNQVSPVARTVSRDSGIATPEPAPQQYDDAYLRTAVTAAAWKPNFS